MFRLKGLAVTLTRILTTIRQAIVPQIRPAIFVLRAVPTVVDTIKAKFAKYRVRSLRNAAGVLCISLWWGDVCVCPCEAAKCHKEREQKSFHDLRSKFEFQRGVEYPRSNGPVYRNDLSKTVRKNEMIRASAKSTATRDIVALRQTKVAPH